MTRQQNMSTNNPGLTDTEMRQAERVGLIYVLVTGVALAVIALGATWALVS